MMANTMPEQLKYYGVKYKEAQNFNDATVQIQEKVKKYYISHKEEIEKYINNDYVLEYIPITDFVNKYLK